MIFFFCKSFVCLPWKKVFSHSQKACYRDPNVLTSNFLPNPANEVLQPVSLQSLQPSLNLVLLTDPDSSEIFKGHVSYSGPGQASMLELCLRMEPLTTFVKKALSEIIGRVLNNVLKNICWSCIVAENVKTWAIPYLLLFLCVVWGINHSTGLLELNRSLRNIQKQPSEVFYKRRCS